MNVRLAKLAAEAGANPLLAPASATQQLPRSCFAGCVCLAICTARCSVLTHLPPFCPPTLPLDNRLRPFLHNIRCHLHTCLPSPAHPTPPHFLLIWWPWPFLHTLYPSRAHFCAPLPPSYPSYYLALALPAHPFLPLHTSTPLTPRYPIPPYSCGPRPACITFPFSCTSLCPQPAPPACTPITLRLSTQPAWLLQCGGQITLSCLRFMVRSQSPALRSGPPVPAAGGCVCAPPTPPAGPAWPGGWGAGEPPPACNSHTCSPTGSGRSCNHHRCFDESCRW